MRDDQEDEMSIEEWRSLYGRHWDLVTRSEEEFDDVDEDYFSDL
jgi:hypothetical protein